VPEGVHIEGVVQGAGDSITVGGLPAPSVTGPPRPTDGTRVTLTADLEHEALVVRDIRPAVRESGSKTHERRRAVEPGTRGENGEHRATPATAAPTPSTEKADRDARPPSSVSKDERERDARQAGDHSGQQRETDREAPSRQSDSRDERRD